MNHRTRITHRTGAVPPAVALIASTACGGEDAEPLTKAEFVQRADAICQETADVAESYWTEFCTDLEGAAAETAPCDAWFPRFGELLADVVPLDRAQIERLRELEPPADDSGLVDTLLGDYEAGLDTIRAGRGRCDRR